MKEQDVLIVGGGVSGTSLLYILSKYSNVKKITLIEKYSKLANVNSRRTNNSQTLHFGDIETNYTLEKATKVKARANLVKNYVEKSKQKKLFSKYHKMVLAVGDKQVKILEKRHNDFKKLFPELKKIGKKDIGKLEPLILKERDPSQKLLALFSPNGYTMDYGALANSFAGNALKQNKEAKIVLNCLLTSIKRLETGEYIVKTNKGLFKSKVVVIASGGHSLMIAHSLGYGKEFSILSIAGSFYFAPKALNGKVYTLQLKKLPFAAIHGDPDVHDQSETRFGPTAKAIFLLERYNPKSFFEYFKTFRIGFKPIASLVNILSEGIIFRYILKNFLYDLPFIGKRLFIKEVRKIVPSMKLKNLRYARKVGGTRPQIINTKTKSLDMGEAKIVGDNIIFNITPSPGASTCLGNAYEDAQKVTKFLGKKFKFNKKDFNNDLAG